MEEVRTVLAREFSGRECASLTPVSRGNHKHTVLVEFADGDSVVVQWSRRVEALRTEAALARLVREHTSIPTPRVLTEDCLDGFGYVVVERARGDDLHERFSSLEPDVRLTAAETFGRFLAELHDVFQFDAYGPVTSVRSARNGRGTLAVSEGGKTAWPAWFRTYARAGVRTLPPSFDDLRPRLFDAITAAELPSAPQSRLFPWDFRPGNALFDAGQISAVVDWGDPLAAAAGLSVAKAQHLVADWYVSDGSTLREAFAAGYESVRPWPTVLQSYRLAAVVHSAVDSRGVVTRPSYPEVDGADAVAFHRERLERLL